MSIIEIVNGEAEKKAQALAIINIILILIVTVVIFVIPIKNHIDTMNIVEYEFGELVERISLYGGATDDMIMDFKTDLSKRVNVSVEDIQVILSDSRAPISVEVSKKNNKYNFR